MESVRSKQTILINLPEDVLFLILEFFSLKEGYKLFPFLCKQFYSLLLEKTSLSYTLLSSHLFLREKKRSQILKNFSNLQFKAFLNEVLTKKKQYSSLPFWGYRTESGLYMNHLRFYFGKSFTNAQSQIVAFNSDRNVHIHGALS